METDEITAYSEGDCKIAESNWRKIVLKTANFKKEDHTARIHRITVNKIWRVSGGQDHDLAGN